MAELNTWLAELDAWLADWLNAKAIFLALIACVVVPPIIAIGRALGRFLGNRRRPTQSRFFQPQKEGSEGLIFMTHGLNKTADSLEPLAKYISETPGYENHDIYLYDYPAGLLSNSAPASLAIELGADLAEVFENTAKKNPNYEIILAGHSLGGLIVRKAYIEAVSSHFNDPDNPKYEHSWAARVTNIVLLAAPNRGSSLFDNSPVRRWTQDYPARLFNLGLLGRSVLRGAEFIVNLRIQWILTYRELQSVPAVAQFVGRRDKEVTLEDSTDITQLPNAYQPEPFDDLDHSTILSARACHIRVREFLLEKKQVTQKEEERNAYAKQDVQTVKTLVMHGIRDYGERFSGEIKPALEKAIRESDLKPVVRAPRYRYFTALSFLSLDPGSAGSKFR